MVALPVLASVTLCPVLAMPTPSLAKVSVGRSPARMRWFWRSAMLRLPLASVATALG